MVVVNLNIWGEGGGRRGGGSGWNGGFPLCCVEQEGGKGRRRGADVNE